MFSQTFQHVPKGRYFISHAYADQDAVKALLARLPRHASPEIFPPILVGPEQRVSDDLIRAIEGCTGLVYLANGASAESFWVSFERDYALRRKKDVFAFDPLKRKLRRDNAEPIRAPVYTSYHRSDQPRVEQLMTWLREQRSFDPWASGTKLASADNLAREMQQGISERLRAGGSLIAFISERWLQSSFARKEIELALASARQQVLIAWLSDPDELQGPDAELCRAMPNAVRLTAGNDWDWNRVDDLVVRVFHLLRSNGIAAAE